MVNAKQTTSYKAAVGLAIGTALAGAGVVGGPWVAGILAGASAIALTTAVIIRRRDERKIVTADERPEDIAITPPTPGVSVAPAVHVSRIGATLPPTGDLEISTREAGGAYYLRVKNTFPKGKVRAQMEIGADSMQFLPQLRLVVSKPTWEGLSSDERALEMGETQYLPIAYQNRAVVPAELTLLVLVYNANYGSDVVWHCPTELKEGSQGSIKFTLRLYYAAFRGERHTVERAFSVGWYGIRAEGLAQDS